MKVKDIMIAIMAIDNGNMDIADYHDIAVIIRTGLEKKWDYNKFYDAIGTYEASAGLRGLHENSIEVLLAILHV